MADIKDFKRNQFLMNQKEAESSRSQKNMQERLSRHKKLHFYRIGIALLVIAVLAAISYVRWINLIYTDYEVRQEYSWSKSAEAHSMELGGLLFSYSKDGMACTDSRGKDVWNQTYEMQNPMVRTCENVVAVGDYNGRSIYVAGTDRIMGTINTTMPIRDFCVAANGIVAAVLDDTTVTAIYLYDVSGNQLAYFKTTMSKSGYPLAIDISDDGQQVALSYLKAENGKMISNVAFYNFSSVGQNYTDNLVGGYGYENAVVPIVSFMNDDIIFAIADNKLMFYQGKQKPVNLTDIWITEEIQSVYHDENYIALIFYDTSGEHTYRMDIYDTSGKKTQELKFDMEYKHVLFDTAGVIIYNENECLIYSWGNILKYEGVFKEPIQCILPTGKIDKYTIVTEDKIQTIRLK